MPQQHIIACAIKNCHNKKLSVATKYRVKSLK